MILIRSVFPRKRQRLGAVSLLALTIVMPSIAGCAKKSDVPPRSAGYYNVKLQQPKTTNN